MSNYSSYSVMLDYDSVRAICWSLGIVSLPCNVVVIFRLLYLNFTHIRSKRLPRMKQAVSLGHRRYTINHNPSIFLLFNLAISDFIASLYLLILAGSDSYYTIYYRNKYGLNPVYSDIENEWVISPTCTAERVLFQITLLMSILMTFIVALDRFILVIYPQSPRKITLASARIAAAICWTLSVVLAIFVGILSAQSASMLSRTHFTIIGQLCLTDSSSSFFVEITTYFELFLGCSLYITSMILYIIVCRKLRQTKSLFRSSSSGTVEKRVSLILASVIFTNIFTYLPITLYTVLGQVLRLFDLYTDRVFPCMVILLYLNSAVNPILFLVLSKKIGRNSQKIGQSTNEVNIINS